MTAPKEESFKAQARDKGGEWKVLLVGSPRAARTAVVAEAGFMARNGWDVVGMSRQEITLADRDDPAKTIEFRVSKVTDG